MRLVEKESPTGKRGKADKQNREFFRYPSAFLFGFLNRRRLRREPQIFNHLWLGFRRFNSNRRDGRRLRPLDGGSSCGGEARFRPRVCRIEIENSQQNDLRCLPILVPVISTLRIGQQYPRIGEASFDV